MKTAYNKAFYDSQEAGSLRSAEAVVPFVYDLLKPSSVVDVGCGLGTWLSVFQRCGVPLVRGYDGAYVDKIRLRIPLERFFEADLREVGGLFLPKHDLAVCLEVAEHLPASVAPKLVRMLTETAPDVLFSAAIPGQGGTDHVNEQWPWYWDALFAQRGYSRWDCLRQEFMHDDRVSWWYKQNMVLYARGLHEQPKHRMEVVHESVLKQYSTRWGLFKALLRSFWR